MGLQLGSHFGVGFLVSEVVRQQRKRLEAWTIFVFLASFCTTSRRSCGACVSRRAEGSVGGAGNG
jgi:hypothetical protein